MKKRRAERKPLAQVAYEACCGFINGVPWEKTSQDVRDTHRNVARAVAREVLRRFRCDGKGSTK